MRGNVTRINFVEKETSITTDKNNSCHPGATAPGFKIAARFRGEKEDVVFTSCSGCSQENGSSKNSVEDVATEDTETPSSARKAADEDCALRRKPSLIHGITEDE